MITTSTFVERRQWRTFNRDAPRGSGYCVDQGQYNLLRKRWMIFGKTVWITTLDREEVPSFVWIRRACLGDDGGWKSRFTDQIHS